MQRPDAWKTKERPLAARAEARKKQKGKKKTQKRKQLRAKNALMAKESTAKKPRLMEMYTRKLVYVPASASPPLKATDPVALAAMQCCA